MITNLTFSKKLKNITKPCSISSQIQLFNSGIDYNLAVLACHPKLTYMYDHVIVRIAKIVH